MIGIVYYSVAKVKQIAGRDALFALSIVLLGLGLVLRYATLDLGSDDLQWLHGESPTVFDNYRYLPRLCFRALNVLFGRSAAAALAMSFSFHILNTLLVGLLSRELTGNRVTSWISAAIFMVNPLTLFTLTWISCFSYVLGAFFCLISLLSFLQVSRSRQAPTVVWYSISLVAYTLGLLCCHEILFLPVALMALASNRKLLSRRAARVFLTLTIGVAMLVNSFVYDFAQYGLKSSKLLTWDFGMALSSSIVSFGASLALSYPLSFFFRVTTLLRACFEEPGRWIVTLLLILLVVRGYRAGRAWRTIAVFAICVSALSAPYIIRLYLMPDTASYHISYVLSGRVFYLPFIFLAIILGAVGAALAASHRVGRLLVAAAAIAYISLLVGTYDKADFLGLQVASGRIVATQASTWTPYSGPATAWPVIVLLLLSISVIQRRRRGMAR